MLNLRKIFFAFIIAIIVLSSGCASRDTAGTTDRTTDESSTASMVATSIGTTAGITTATQETTPTTTGTSVAGTTSTTTTATTKPATTAATTSTTTREPTATIPAVDSADYIITLKRDLLILLLAYPDNITGIETENGNVYVIMASGVPVLYDDRRSKSFSEKLADADLQDMLEMPYPLGTVDTLMGDNLDPGRVRCYPFFNAIYGNSKTAVTKNLVTVKWGTKNLSFNKQAGAAAALQAVSDQAAALAAEQPDVTDCLYPSSGTFNYRVIAGTDRLSPHAYGIAIDINSADGGYWRWMSPEDGAKLIGEFPQDVVRIFERNNFIWGGKWNHFDLFHFEYRPEMILKARIFASDPDPAQPWHQGADLGDEVVQRCVSLIDESLGH